MNLYIIFNCIINLLFRSSLLYFIRKQFRETRSVVEKLSKNSLLYYGILFHLERNWTTRRVVNFDYTLFFFFVEKTELRVFITYSWQILFIFVFFWLGIELVRLKNRFWKKKFDLRSPNNCRPVEKNSSNGSHVAKRYLYRRYCLVF